MRFSETNSNSLSIRPYERANMAMRLYRITKKNRENCIKALNATCDVFKTKASCFKFAPNLRHTLLHRTILRHFLAFPVPS